MALLPPPEARYPPKENDDPKKTVPPKAGTVWAVALSGVDDIRCQFREVHVHSVLHALGLNPNSPWPPEADELEDTR